MNKKTLAIIGVITVLLIGIVSAGLLDYFGRISESVTVEGPVFYLSDTKVTINNVTSRALNLNNYDGNNGITSFTGTDSQWFITDELGVNSFYPANYTFYIKACAKNNTETNLSGQIDLTLRVLHSSGNLGEIICGTSIENVSSTSKCLVGDYLDYPSLSCTGNSLNLGLTDRIVLIASDGMNDIQYKIKMDGASRIEVSAA